MNNWCVPKGYERLIPQSHTLPVALVPKIQFENYNIFDTCEVTARVSFGATGLRSVSERSGPQVGPTLMHPLNVGPSNSDFI
jgi:hypothetical protein